MCDVVVVVKIESICPRCGKVVKNRLLTADYFYNIFLSQEFPFNCFPSSLFDSNFEVCPKCGKYAWREKVVIEEKLKVEEV